MKTAIAAFALALLAATKHVDAFAPAVPSLLRTLRTQQQKVKFSSVRIFDKPINKNDEMEMEMRISKTTPDLIMDKKKQQEQRNASTDPTPFFVSLFQNANNLKMAAAAMAFALMLLPLPSEASMSGGRMGGGSFSSSRSSSSSSSRLTYSVDGYGGNFIVLFIIFALWEGDAINSSLGSGTSVVQLSVAMQVPDRDDPNSILGRLNHLSESARTDTRVGVANLTSQVALEILRQKSSIVAASGKTKDFGGRAEAQREYQSISIRERAKFETETISKYDGVDYSSKRQMKKASGSSVSSKSTMAVITLVLAIDGNSTNIPEINSMSDVQQALERIASDAKVDDCLQSAEILWTPEDRSETLSLSDVMADYPELLSV
jgi:uncharacterized membrane protein